MPEIKIVVPDLGKWVRVIKDYPNVAGPILQKAIVKSIVDIRTKTIPETPIRTGNLRKSFMMTIAPLLGILRPTAYYATFVHEGTKFMRPNPYMQRGVDASQEIVTTNFSQALQEIIRQTAGKLQ